MPKGENDEEPVWLNPWTLPLGNIVELEVGEYAAEGGDVVEKRGGGDDMPA